MAFGLERVFIETHPQRPRDKPKFQPPEDSHKLVRVFKLLQLFKRLGRSKCPRHLKCLSPSGFLELPKLVKLSKRFEVLELSKFLELFSSQLLKPLKLRKLRGLLRLPECTKRSKSPQALQTSRTFSNSLSAPNASSIPSVSNSSDFPSFSNFLSVSKVSRVSQVSEAL